MAIPRLLRAVGDIGRIEAAMPAQGCIAWSSDAKTIPRHGVSELILKFSSGAARVSISCRRCRCGGRDVRRVVGRLVEADKEVG